LVLITVGAVAGFLAWLGVTVTDDVQLSRDGVVVTATVEGSAPYGEETQYLLSFAVDGQSAQRWSADVGSLRVGDTVHVIVDRNDHTHFETTAAFGRRWPGYIVQVLVAAAFAWLSIVFIRMDAADFQQYLRARGGRV
jgi:hypothetical protein